MKKIAFLIDSIHFGGPGNVLRNIIKNMDYKSFEVTLILLFKERNDQEIIDDFKNMGVRVIRFDFKNKLEFLMYGRKKLNSIIDKYKFDVVHSHGFCPDVLNGQTKCKNKIATVHCNIFEDYEQTYGKLKSVLMINSQLIALKKFNYVACVSQTVQNSIKNHLKNTTLVYNGIEPVLYNEYPSREDVSISEDAIIYIYIGRLSKGKNVIWLLNEFHKNRRDNEYLLVFGRGPLRDQCLEIKDDNIKMMGFLSNAKAYMKISDFYVSASKSEGFAISVIEAMDMGMGMFISDIPSHREVFELDKNLYLGELFNPDNFAEKMEFLRNNKNKVSSAEMMKLKKEKLSAEKMTEDYMKIYEKLIKEK